MSIVQCLRILLLAVLANLFCANALIWPTPTCNKLVDSYERDYGKHVTPKNISDAFIFFLHVPRTAGKTYATCFLRAALPASQRCSPSYDLLRLNVSQEGCRYLVSHDDYSITSILPENTLVVTQLRDPVTRVLSAYEFAIEVASRRIKIDDKKFFEGAKKMTFVNTLNVWPWSHLVPWFRKDMQIKMAALDAQANEEGAPPRVWTEHFDNRRNRTYYWSKALNQSVWKLPAANTTLHPYSNVLVTPLVEWIETEEAQEFVHEGATLQILGLTNYSHWESAKDLRNCFFKDTEAQKRLVDIAKQRLRSMLHVGLTENLDESVASMAAGLGFNLSSTSHRSTSRNYFAYDAIGFDMDQIITYNASRTVPEGEMTSISIREARNLVIKLNRQAGALNKQLSKLEPQLQELVDKEDKWLEEESIKKKEGNVTMSTVSSSVVDKVLQKGLNVTRTVIDWIKRKSVVLVPSWPPKVAAEVDTKEERSSDGASDTDLDNNDDKDSQDASSSDKSSSSSAGSSSGGSEYGENAPRNQDNNDLDNDDEDLDDRGDHQLLEEEEEEEEKIDSPWSEEIEALDAKVFTLQQKRDSIQRDIDALMANPLVKGPPMPEGPAKLLVPDSEFEDKDTPLGQAYRQCSRSATKKAADKRRGAFKDLVTPWHESFGFSSAQRKTLDSSIIERIRELNVADMEIWELGKKLLDEALAEQSAGDTLQQLPPPIVENDNNSTSTADNNNITVSNSTGSEKSSAEEQGTTTQAAAPAAAEVAGTESRDEL